MPEENNNQNVLPTVPFLGPLQPWVNLIHTVGLPWVIIGISVYYAVPFAKDVVNISKEVRDNQDATNKRLDTLDDHARKAMPLLEEANKAIPLLKQIHETTKEGAMQRHQDIQKLEELRADKFSKENNGGN